MPAFHAVQSSIKLLEAAGFKPIKEKDSWSNSVTTGGKYYLTRNGSSIVAFAVGKRWKSGNPIAMIGAHTDSPTLRLKPVSKKTNAGFLQIGVETYGGGIWHTWFDRDLSIAGRVMVRDAEGNFVQKLVKVERPIVRIPTLAIHLHRETNFDPNKETELFPIAGLIAAELNRTGQGGKEEAKKDDGFNPLANMTDRHHPVVLEIIAEHAGCKVEDVVDFEMVLYDTQKSCIGGINNELIYSARLDNLNMTYCSVISMIESLKSSSALDDERCIRLVTCFDHEEIGSTTAQGAASNLLPAIIKRLSLLPSASEAASVASSEKSWERVRRESDADNSTALEQTLATSFLISADMAHSVNPNYTHKYESDHRPEMNKGTVIKINANARYATSSPGIVLLQEVARLAKPSADSKTSSGVPLQLFVVRNDSSCGSTIGPMLSAALGTRTLDLGNPQLSMHSIRECGGVYDVEHAIRLFESFYENFGKLESKILVD